MKRLRTIVILVLVSAILMGAAYAATNAKEITAYFRDIQITVRNGGRNVTNVTGKITDVNGTVQEAIIIDGTAYVPLRGISEILGYDVAWDGSTSTISISGFAPYYTAPGNDYDIIPISMYMQAGHEQWEAWPEGTMTVHAGEGYIDPFGVGTYTMGAGYPEQTAEFTTDVWLSDWWKSAFCGGSFCMYQMADGDIYCLDGVYGKIEVNALDSEKSPDYNYGREDALINIIVGGTGAYEGATGIILGHTPSTGSQEMAGVMVLPQALFKFMQGYIKIPHDPSTVSYTADPDDNSTAELVEFADDARAIEVNMVMKAGSTEYTEHPGGTRTIHSGIGYMYPFGYGGDASYVAGIGYSEQTAIGQPGDYFKQNFIDEYNASLFCIYTVEGMGDMFVFDGLWGNMLKEEEEIKGVAGELAQRQDALVNVVVGGNGDFEGMTGILMGKTMGAGEYTDVGGGYTLPSTLLKVMTGYVKMDSSSGAYEYARSGGFMN